MLRHRQKYLDCFYCGRRSDTYSTPAVRMQFDCKYCNATNYLDRNGEITNPPVDKVNAGSASLPLYSPRPLSPDVVSPGLPPDPESIFCEACLKHQRLFVASIAQYESESNNDDFNLDKDYYRYRRNLVERYPQCCERCKPRVEEAIKKADYRAKTDYMRKMTERGRDPRTRATTKWTKIDYLDQGGKMLWWLALVLQLLWHIKIMPGIALTSSSGLTDPEDKTWLTQGLKWISDAGGYLPGNRPLILWSFVATLSSAWWNPKISQVLRGFDRHLLGLNNWYTYQGLLLVMRFALYYFSFDQQSRNAKLSAHILTVLMAIGVTSRARRAIKTDTTPLFGNSGKPVSLTPDPAEATRERFSFRKQPSHQPTLAETLNGALPLPDEKSRKGSDDYGLHNYQFPAAPKAAPSFSREAKEDMMEWQPTGSTTLPRALRHPADGAGNRSFGEAPVQENNRPFYYRAPRAPTNPSKEARTAPIQPAIWGSQRPQKGFEPQSRSANPLEFPQPRFFAQQPGPDREHDEQLAGLAGGLSFKEEESKKGGFFGFGRK